MSCVNALSDMLKATVYRDGKVWEQEYARGKAQYPVKQVGDTGKTGTLVTFSPDPTIFAQTREYNYDTLASRMRELAYLNKGIKIQLTDHRQKDEKGETVSELFHSEEGLKEFIRFLDANREPITTDVISMEGENNIIPVEVFFF